MNSKVQIVDTTLRDGEQTAGVVFANKEKVRIAKMLNELGVHQIEAGIPVMGGDEEEVITKIVNSNLKSSIMGWNRAVIEDVKTSLKCGVDAVAISISTSDIHIKNKLNSTREEIKERMIKAAEFAKENDVYVSVNAEDASRSDMDYLVEFGKAAKEAGADRLRFCDTVGILTPFSTYEKIKYLIDEIGIDIEMHMHNDFGLATANTLAGIKAGAKYAGVTILGLGERAGNAALEEVVMALKYLEKEDLNFKTQKFREVCEYVSHASGRILPAWKPVVGTNMFAHESGIHTDGVLKDPLAYEVFAPEEVGLERQIVIGKHSGTKAIKAKFKEYGREIDDEEARELLARVRAAAVDLKRSLFDKELAYIYEDYEEQKSS